MRRRWTTRSLAAIVGTGAALVGFGSTPGGADTPDVVASIKPVHSLVAGVMAGVGEPVLLVRGGASPHTYSLRPSDARALHDAGVVFWIGDGLETFLEKPLDALPRRARVVALGEAEGITLLPFREGGEHADEKHGEHHEEHAGEEHGEHHEDHHDGGGHDHAHGHGAVDMHVWLDPVNAKAMVGQIVATLSDADPANAARYQANGETIASRLARLNTSIASDVAPIRERPYVVFHDAYQYFEERYGLHPAGSITVSPDRQPSAAKLSEIREAITATEAACVFSEPQFEPAVVQAVIEGTAARTGVLDPLGADLEPGPDAYFALMQNLAASLRECLTPQS